MLKNLSYKIALLIPGAPVAHAHFFYTPPNLPTPPPLVQQGAPQKSLPDFVVGQRSHQNEINAQDFSNQINARDLSLLAHVRRDGALIFRNEGGRRGTSIQAVRVLEAQFIPSLNKVLVQAVLVERGQRLAVTNRGGDRRFVGSNVYVYFLVDKPYGRPRREHWQNGGDRGSWGEGRSPDRWDQGGSYGSHTTREWDTQGSRSGQAVAVSYSTREDAQVIFWMLLRNPRFLGVVSEEAPLPLLTINNQNTYMQLWLPTQWPLDVRFNDPNNVVFGYELNRRLSLIGINFPPRPWNRGI